MAATTAVWGDAPLVWIATNWGALLTCASLTSDVAALVVYIHARITGTGEGMSGGAFQSFPSQLNSSSSLD